MADPPLTKGKLSYPRKRLDDALTAVRNGMAYRAAAREFGIPVTTLHDIIKQKYSRYGRSGPRTLLSEEEEGRIAEWIRSNRKAGFPMIADGVIACAQKLLNSAETSHRVLGKKWFQSFLKRHPELAQCVPEKLSASRASDFEDRIRLWFLEAQSYLEEHGSLDILVDPARIFTVDETAFVLCLKTEKVLGPKGERSVYAVASESDKEYITMLVSCQASGSFIPPMLLYPYTCLSPEIKQSAPAEWAVAGTKSGSTTSEVFYEYITTVLYQWLKENNIKFPVLLLVDGHNLHLSFPLSDFCAEKQILLVALPCIATHLFRPLDVAVFSSLKAKWKTVLHDYRARNNTGVPIGRKEFPGLMSSVLNLDGTGSAVASAFRRCGIYPWNADAVDFRKCVRDTAGAAASDWPGELSYHEYLVSEVERMLDGDTLIKFHETAATSNKWDGSETYRLMFDLWSKHCDAIKQ